MRKYLLFLLLTFTLAASAQTFERPYYSYSLKSLPRKPFNRTIVNTFSPMVKLDPGMKMVFNEYEACGRLNMPGFKKMGPASPGQQVQSDLLYTASFGDARIISRDVIENKTEIKNSDGKVTGYNYSYHVDVIYGYKGEASLSDNNGQIIDQTFYTDEKALWRSSQFATREKAVNYYNDNMDDIRTSLRKNAFENCAKAFDIWLSQNYTYPTVKMSAKFLIVNSKKHPEYEDFQKIKDVLKGGCDLVTANTTLDKARLAFIPAIKFFEDMLAKYSDNNDKKIKKIRYAILYDLAKIYEVLDDYEKSNKYGQLIIKNDFTPVEGKEFCREAEICMERLKTNNRSDYHPVFEF